MKNVSPARIAAFEILIKIETERAFSSALLPRYEEDLAQKDRGLCHELTLGVLRRKLELDGAIESLTGKKISKLDVEVLVSLRIGIYQLLFLDRVPAYSAINESVNLIYRAKKRSAAGLVNAVLRKVSRGEIPNRASVDEYDRISSETSHPRWLIENWSEQFGIAEAERIATANNVAPRSSFRFTSKYYSKGTAGRKAILSLLDEDQLQPSEFVEDSFVVERSSSILRDLAESGEIYFQDEGSQMVGNYVNLAKGESFIDVCAAPGSKVTFIRSTCDSSDGSFLVAGDYYEHRLSVLRANCINQGADNINFARYDAGESLPFMDQGFDAVLVDSPCSGTGTIRSNPEIRYSLEPKDLLELQDKQLNFLINASKLVKSGGRLIYSTCSLEIAENEEVIEKFLNTQTGFQNVGPVSGDKLRTEKGFCRTFPHRDGIDGFFVAILKRS